MPGPSIYAIIRHYLGRALRETGQALDRVGARGVLHANTKREVGDDAYTFERIFSRHRQKMELLHRGAPRVHSNTFIAPCSHLIGSVAIGEGSSVWYGAVLRADRCRNGVRVKEKRVIESDEDYFDVNDDSISDPNSGIDGFGGGVINVGRGSNIQDGVIITAKTGHSTLGDNVTVGHSAQIHSATIGSNVLIGMGSKIFPGAKIESNTFIAAGAIVPPDVTVPSGELWAGQPAKKLKSLSKQQLDKIKYQASEVSFKLHGNFLSNLCLICVKSTSNFRVHIYMSWSSAAMSLVYLKQILQ